ncbi:hypothetical protein KAS08_01015 [Candidatus Pacearchaeota archaeon]|nr:hypothetical protein [Candidatus Pacearchaeota archaeon]
MVMIGMLLGVSLAIMFSSLGVILLTATGAVKQGLVTGAVIGSTGAISYAVISFILSLVAVFFLALIIKKPEKELEEYYAS